MADVDIAKMVMAEVAERLDRKPDEVTLEAKFIEDLGADSLDVTELLMAFEETFNVEIDDDATAIETVAEAIKYIESKL